jgi:predicted phage baseplate assembly protein
MTASLVPLPNLDDRRWSDLVDEARTLIPVYASAWTDHNAHDPGITLLEMLAWIAETDIYRVNQIPDSHIRAFLALIGLQPLPPSPARAVVALSLKAAPAVALPATTQFDTPAGKFQSRQAASILPVTLAAVQVQAGGRITDKTGEWRRGRPFAVFGPTPQPGDCLYLGFDGGLEKDNSLSVHLTFAGDKATETELRRLLAEVADRAESCSRLKLDCCLMARASDGGDPCRKLESSGNLDGFSRHAGSCAVPLHHSVAIAWEIQTASGIWQAVEADDDTRSFSLSGPVVLSLPAAAVARTGAVGIPLAYVRARFVSGAFDAAPVVARLLANAVEVEQAVPAWDRWAIAPKVVPSGTVPAAGDATWIKPTFDDSGQLSTLAFTAGAEDALAVRVLAYQAATDSRSGLLTLEAKRLGTVSGAPNQVYRLAGPKVREADFRLYTVEPDMVRPWRQRANLAASGPADADFLLDAGSAEVQFGDGRNGLVPPFGATVVAVAQETAGSGANVAAGTITALDGGPHNVALLGGDPAAVAANFEQIANPDPAWGGTDEESLTHAEGRAVERMLTPSRAVTLADCEALALATPGTALARAAALANQHPALQCYAAPGFITLVIIPYLPLGRPVPSPGLIGAVSAYVNRRRVIGTRIEVVGPEYLEIGVVARVKAFVGQSKTAVRDAVVAALQAFLDPLAGGPNGTGWPLGREVPISEILDLIARVPGIDHVLSLGLSVPGCGIQCGNVCLRPLALTVSGTHQIQVS